MESLAPAMRYAKMNQTMRTLSAAQVRDAVAQAAVDANYVLSDDMIAALEAALRTEVSPNGREALHEILANAKIAADGRFPLCQDTGLAVLFVELGEDARVEGGLRFAIEEGVRKGYGEAFLRKSVCDPFTRQNTGSNLPAIIHVDIVPGDRLTIDFLAKGGGSENMSRAAVLPPSAGEEGVIEFAVGAVRAGGINACPPITVGLGVGGNLELAAMLSKKALTRELGTPSPDPTLARIERETLERINKLGIGPGALGGTVTALAVHAIAVPCHIASLPVAVTLECHAHRHRRIVL